MKAFKELACSRETFVAKRFAKANRHYVGHRSPFLCVVVLSNNQSIVNDGDDEVAVDEPNAMRSVQLLQQQLEPEEQALQLPSREPNLSAQAKPHNACTVCVDQVRYKATVV
jgi:hypothetical protein